MHFNKYTLINYALYYSSLKSRQGKAAYCKLVGTSKSKLDLNTLRSLTCDTVTNLKKAINFIVGIWLIWTETGKWPCKSSQLQCIWFSANWKVCSCQWHCQIVSRCRQCRVLSQCLSQVVANLLGTLVALLDKLVLLQLQMDFHQCQCQGQVRLVYHGLGLVSLPAVRQ